MDIGATVRKLQSLVFPQHSDDASRARNLAYETRGLKLDDGHITETERSLVNVLSE